MPVDSSPTPVQPDDLFRLRFIHSAALSPDGTKVVFAYSFYDEDSQEDRVALHLHCLGTNEERRLTIGMARDTHPSWSPDGKQVAFLSDRRDKPQIYVLPMDGGEPRPLTQLEQGVASGPVWSPDGRHIAFTAPPAKPPLDLEQPYRLTRTIYRFDMVGYVDNAVQDIYVASLEDGRVRQLTDDACQNGGLSWSPDGKQILYHASMFPDEPVVVHPRLRVVTLDGEIRELVSEWGYSLSAAWHPDGQRIVFLGAPHGRPIGSKLDLWVVPAAGGEPECRSAEIIWGIGGRLQSDMPALREVLVAPKILIDPGTDQAYVQAQIGGTVQVLRVALAGPPQWTPVLTGDRSCLPLALAGERLLAGVSTLSNPGDLYITDLNGQGEKAITELNQAVLSERVLPDWEHLTFPGNDGVEVEGWLLKPVTGTPPYPTILYIHGGPHSGFGHIFSFDFQMLAGAGYAVLFINQRGSTGYGDEFATRILGDWGNLDYRDLMAGVDAAVERGLADPDRLGCCGLSGGGYLSTWIVGHTNRFKAAVPENPVTNWVSFYGVSDIGPWFAVEELGGKPHEIPEVYRRCSPITYAHLCTTPTLLIQGEADYRCPAEQSEQFFTVLKLSGCPVEMVRLPQSPHGGSIAGPPAVRRAQNDALLEWLNRYVLEE